MNKKMNKNKINTHVKNSLLRAIILLQIKYFSFYKIRFKKYNKIYN